MSRATSTLLFVLAACGLRVYDFDATDGASSGDTSGVTGDGSSSSTSSSTTAQPTTTGNIDPPSTSGSTGSTGHDFITPVDGGTRECDQLTQNCPEGQKCTHASLDGDNALESQICVPLARDPAGLYEPCVSEGTSGVDTCDIQMMCWAVDPETGMGTCYGLCSGSWDHPVCEDPNADCLLGQDGFNICIPGCSPLLQDCSNGDLCVPNPMDPNSFICVIDASGEEGQAFDICEYANACDAGLLCGNPALAKECDAQAPGCCVPFCDLSAPTCPGSGQQCLPWFEEGQAPPGDENVGVCGLPS